MENSVFETLDGKGIKPVVVGKQKAVRPGPVNGYVYKDAKATQDWDMDRIRTFLKTEINAEPNNDPEQVWYNVDYASNQKQGRFYALKCHLGQKKQKTIKKAYNVDELATYFFGPICKDDFNGYSQSPETWAKRQAIWNQFYNRQAWVLHMKGGNQSEVDKKFDAAKKRAEERKAAGERSVFEDLILEPTLDKRDPLEHEKNAAAQHFEMHKKPLLSAIAHQMTKDVLYTDVYSNGIEIVINGINEKYLSEDEKKAIISFKDRYDSKVFDLTDEVLNMIEAVAKRIGTKVPVYRAGQGNPNDPVDMVHEEHYSTNKDRVHEWVKGLVKDVCEANSDNLEELGFDTYEEYLESEMSKVFCYRVY